MLGERNDPIGLIPNSKIWDCLPKPGSTQDHWHCTEAARFARCVAANGFKVEGPVWAGLSHNVGFPAHRSHLYSLQHGVVWLNAVVVRSFLDGRFGAP